MNQLQSTPSDTTEAVNPISLDIDDKILADTIDQRISNAKKAFQKKQLYKRQRANERAYLGDITGVKNKYAYKDNMIYLSEASIKPIALSRLPDLIIAPGNESADAKVGANGMTNVVNSDIRKRQNRQVLSIAYKHIPIYFFAVIKYRWNPEIGKYGDYVFEVVHPDRITLDHTAKSNNIEDMQFIAEKLPMTLKEAVMRFPKKKNELLDLVDPNADRQKSESGMATPIEIEEVWFKWYRKLEDEGRYQKEYGVLWKYKDLILEKMKNPNWDWEGSNVTFAYDEKGNKRPVDEEELKQRFIQWSMTGDFQAATKDLGSEKVFHNYFKQPEFPYIILSYEQWGNSPVDITTRVEQNIGLQETLNLRGRQINEIADFVNGIDVFSTDSGLSADDLKNIDTSDPKQKLLIDGDVRSAYTKIQGTAPVAALYQEQSAIRDRIASNMGVNSTTRGQVSTDTATVARIAREADYGRIDDNVEETINYAAERMARAALQMIKLRYTEEHLREDIGKDGQVASALISRNLVNDGMSVLVKASGTDKMQRKREAFELAGMKMIDPLTFFEDIGASNPKERTKRVLDLQRSPDEYYTQYVLEHENTEQMVEAISNQTTTDNQEAQASPSQETGY